MAGSVRHDQCGLVGGRVGGIEHAHLRRRFIRNLEHQPALFVDCLRRRIIHIISQRLHIRRHIHRYIVLVCVRVTFDGAFTPLNALEYPGWLFQVSEVYDQILPGILGCRVNVDVFPVSRTESYMHLIYHTERYMIHKVL